jgi:nucleotide-binding universal stress UspA family protein
MDDTVWASCSSVQSRNRFFRQADCPVLTFGPHTDARPWFGTSSAHRIFLFATDFGPASLHGLPRAIAAANQFQAKLAFLSIIPAPPSSTEKALTDWEENARMRTVQQLAELADDAGLDTRPQMYVEFTAETPVSERILETADKLRADLIIMGLHDSGHAGIVSHLDLATTYDVICQARIPVLTVNDSSGSDLEAHPTKVSVPSASDRRYPQSGVRNEEVDEIVTCRRPGV